MTEPMATFQLDHVALLVKSVEATSKRLAALGWPVNDIESFPGEGTRECYVGSPDHTARLLLCEAADPDGPYGRALAKRGPGIHHVAVNVTALDDYIDDLSGSGWLLLPQSLRTIRDGRTAWLARPGTGLLVEVHERTSKDRPAFLTRLEIPGGPRLSLRLERLAPQGARLVGLAVSTDERAWIAAQDHRLQVDELAHLG